MVYSSLRVRLAGPRLSEFIASEKGIKHELRTWVPIGHKEVEPEARELKATLVCDSKRAKMGGFGLGGKGR